MVGLVQRALGALHLDFAAEAAREIDTRRDQFAAEIVSRLGRGNVCIQDDLYLTSDELDAEVAGLPSLKFDRN